MIKEADDEPPVSSKSLDYKPLVEITKSEESESQKFANLIRSKRKIIIQLQQYDYFYNKSAQTDSIEEANICKLSFNLESNNLSICSSKNHEKRSHSKIR